MIRRQGRDCAWRIIPRRSHSGRPSMRGIAATRHLPAPGTPGDSIGEIALTRPAAVRRPNARVVQAQAILESLLFRAAGIAKNLGKLRSEV